MGALKKHELGIQRSLDVLSLKTGMGTGRYQFDASGVKTATEVISEKSDLYQNLQKNEISIKAALINLVKAVAFLDTGSDVEVTVDFDDSIIEDSNTTIDRNIKLVQGGLRSKLTANMEIYKCSETDTKKELERIVQDGQITGQDIMLMQNIVRHLKGYDQSIDTDKWLLQKLAEIGRLNKENMQLIAKMAGVSNTAAERMLQDMAEEAIQSIDPGLRNLAKRNLVGDPVTVSKRKNVKQAKDILNKCNTTMLYKERDAYKKLVHDITKESKEIANKQEFLDILNKNTTAATIGAESRQQVMRRCIQEFNEKGIPAFVDKRGKEWTPESYVNMAMRNTVRQTAEEVQTVRCKDMGVYLIAIDSHSGLRPKCAKDQGKIFALDNTSGETEDAAGRKIMYYPWNSSSYGEPDGILGINCGHHKFPFVPGENIHRYFPTEDLDANNKLYQDTQVQRALERDVRKQKRECMLYDEIGDTDAFERASIELKQKEVKLKTYVDCKDHLHRYRDREQVVGVDRGVSSRAVESKKQIASKVNSMYDTGSENGNIKAYYRDKPLRDKLQSNALKKDLEPG